MTVQITMLAPLWCPFDSPPGRPASGLSGPGRLLQGHFLQTNSLVLGTEGCLNGHKHPQKPTPQPTNVRPPTPKPKCPPPPKPMCIQLQTLGRAELSLLQGHVLDTCPGWRTYLDARFWDSRLTSQFFPGSNRWEVNPHEGLHKDLCS